MGFVVFGSGIWFAAFALIVNATANFQSKLFFKVIPFFLGSALVVIGSKMIGWL